MAEEERVADLETVIEVIKLLPQAIGVFHDDGNLAYANAALSKLLGTSEGELSGISMASIVDESDWKHLEPLLTSVGSVRARSRTSALWIEVAVSRLADGHRMVTVTDQSAQVAAEQALTSLAEDSSEFVVLVDGARRITWAAPSIMAILGHTPSALLGKGIEQLVSREDLPIFGELPLSEAPSNAQRPIRFRTAAGGYRFMTTTASWVQTHPELADSQIALHAVVEKRVGDRNSGSGSGNGLGADSASSMNAVLGWATSLLTSTPLTAFVPRSDLGPINAARALVRQGGEVSSEVLRFPAAAVASRRIPFGADGGLVTGLARGMRDATGERRSRRATFGAEEQLRMALNGAPEGMAVTDESDTILQANPALAGLLAMNVEELIHHQFSEFMPQDERAKVDTLRDQLRNGTRDTVRLEHRLSVEGAELWVDHAIGVLRDEKDRPQLYVHQFADRTQTRLVHEDLTFRATHDIQTGLANRASLLTRLEDRLGLSPTHSGQVGVLFCDIDNLKTINDELGHAAGDAAIAAVADRLSSSVRQHDLVGRIGGDEFVVVLDQCPNIQVLMTVAENLQRAASGPVQSDESEVSVTVSVGAVLAEANADPDDTLERADLALYRAKRSGRNQVAGEQDVP